MGGGHPIFAAITADNQLKTFTGRLVPATLVTGAVIYAQTRTPARAPTGGRRDAHLQRGFRFKTRGQTRSRRPLNRIRTPHVPAIEPIPQNKDIDNRPLEARNRR